MSYIIIIVSLGSDFKLNAIVVNVFEMKGLLNNKLGNTYIDEKIVPLIIVHYF